MANSNQATSRHETNQTMRTFLGGGAFHVLSKYEFETVYASDINSDLILCYNQIKYTPSKVNKHLQDLVEAYPKSNPARDDFYYAIRDSWNSKVRSSLMTEDEKCLRVAQTIFLNKTCFNGLFRLNSKGEFNVPTGRYVNPAFPTESHIEEVSKSIQNVVFQVQSYESVIQVADQHTLVYFDPPYRPISKTSSSNIYTKVDFDDNNQIQLAEFVKTLDSKGVQFLLSNSDPVNFGNEDDFFDELYRFSNRKGSCDRVVAIPTRGLDF